MIKSRTMLANVPFYIDSKPVLRINIKQQCLNISILSHTGLELIVYGILIINWFLMIFILPININEFKEIKIKEKQQRELRELQLVPFYIDSKPVLRINIKQQCLNISILSQYGLELIVYGT